MKTRFLSLFAATILFFSGCLQQESPSQSNKKGSFSLEACIEATLSEYNEGHTMRHKLRSEDPKAPTREQLLCTILDKNNQRIVQEKAAKFSTPYALPAGQYEVLLHYGDPLKEGFEGSYYEGKKAISISEGENTTCSITCHQQKAALQVFFSEEVKKYFSEVALQVQNNLSTEAIRIAPEENNIAYFRPGELTLTLIAKKSGTQVSRIAIGTISPAEPQHLYHIHINIDAGGSTLHISYDSPTEAMPTVIDVSDDILNASAPSITSYGAKRADNIIVQEGIKKEAHVLLLADAGLKSCRLTFGGDVSKIMGLPASVDLLQSAEEDKKHQLLDNGLLLKEMHAATAHAVVDFSAFLTLLSLQPQTHDKQLSIGLEVIDRSGKTAEEALRWQVMFKALPFDIGSLSPCVVGSTHIDLPLLFGDEKMVESTEDLHQLKDKLQILLTDQDTGKSSTPSFELIKGNPITLRIDTEPLLSTKKIKVTYAGVKSKEVIATIRPIRWRLYQQNGTADSWTNHAQALLTIDEEEKTRDFILRNLTLSVKSDQTGVTSRLQSVVKGKQLHIALSNLKPSCSYTLTAQLSMQLQQVLKIQTEDALQLPNSNFEEWDSFAPPGVAWRVFYPWKDRQQVPAIHWDTSNEISAGPGLYEGSKVSYRATASVMKSQEAHTGHSAALVRTVGYGRNATAAGALSVGVQICIGELYLGYFDKEKKAPHEGIAFASRPKALSLYCKYLSKNSHDHYTIAITLLASDGSTIAHGALAPSEATPTSNYILKKIPLVYSDTSKKANTIKVMIRSGIDNSNSSSNIDYGSIRNDAEHIGSRLYVDDISLIYE